MKKVVVAVVIVVLCMGCWCKICRAEGCNGGAIEVPMTKVYFTMAPCGAEGTVQPDYFEMSVQGETSFDCPVASTGPSGQVRLDVYKQYTLNDGDNVFQYRAVSNNPLCPKGEWDTVTITYKVPIPLTMGRYSVIEVGTVSDVPQGVGLQKKARVKK